MTTRPAGKEPAGTVDRPVMTHDEIVPMKRNRQQSNLSFRCMAAEFRIRDWLRPPINMLRDIGLLPGMTILDFGCGPGGYSLAAAHLVGAKGQVYALDIHPLALCMVMKAAKRRGLQNIHPILGSYPDDLPNESMDVVLLYDVLHDIPDTDSVLREIRRVLKPDGILSASDHHYGEAALLSKIAGSRLFRLAKCNRLTCQFMRVSGDEKLL